MSKDDLEIRLNLALQARSHLVQDEEHRAALRLFAGFYEGVPKQQGVPQQQGGTQQPLVADLYARTLVLFDYAKSAKEGAVNLQHAQDFYLDKLPWIDCVVQKRRAAKSRQSRRGVLTMGETPAKQIVENDVIYAIDLLMNQDSSFYLDTRNLRSWLRENSMGWEVLNTFAYTGSLGIAALTGGAAHVVQTDRSKKFLATARQSAMCNKYDLGRMLLRGVDFFSEIAHLKRNGKLFDCVILDPPFFSSTTKGTVDLVNENTRLINKVRPLIKDGGWLVTINNALFLSGADYVQSLETLCRDGFLSIEQIIPIPEDITGFPETIMAPPPADPSPFNHPTKIALLSVKRKA